uniref:Uncharacterized protein n=1 Tax=Ceratitis capitata TaxID=7213 RepID=W8AFX3_CERCA
MGFRYQDLKERGDSIELERRESFTTERSHNGYIKRKKTIVRERFPHPHAKEGSKHKQHSKRSAVQVTNRPAAESAHTTTETYVPSAGSGALVTTCRDKSHLERAVNRTSVQLKRLAHEIDNEIAKLKRERDKLMFRPRPHPLTRNAAIQNDLNVNDEPINKLKDFNHIVDNIEFTIEKFSSRHKFVCASPRYARDEQTSCRPRMRTIGLQKNTQRSTVEDGNIESLKAKLGTALHYSATNLANLKSKGLLDSVPPNCYAFDYGGTGDGQNALNVYHLQKGRCAGGCNQNDCNCQKICEHYNSVGNYNGMLCNKNTYVEKGLTPCNEYKYCRDEYHYNYPQQSNCVVPTTNQPCMPYSACVPTCPPCQPCIPWSPPCPTYAECQPDKPKIKVLYGRRATDLNTEDFFQPTGSSPKKHSASKHGSTRHSRNKERLTVDVPKDGRTSVEIERSGDRARSKTRRKKENEDKLRQRNSTRPRGVAADKTNEKRQSRERKAGDASASSGSDNSSEKRRQMKSKEKLLEITFTKERRHRPSSGSGDEGVPYVTQKPEREYSRETKRSMKQMTITAYKPCRPEDSEGKPDVDRKKQKRRKSIDRVGNDDQSDDDKTWDERLRQTEYPREQVDWQTGVPTITEVYDEYRVGDAWEGEEDAGTKQMTRRQYLGSYRELYHVPPQSNYDIMPVQRNTVRDIPPTSTRSPERGQRTRSPVGQGDRTRGFSQRERAENDIGLIAQPRTGRWQNDKPSRPYERPDSNIVPEGQARTRRDIPHSKQPDAFRTHALEERPRLDDRYGPAGKPPSDRRSARDYSRNVQPRQYGHTEFATRPHESYDHTQNGVYSPNEKPRSGEKYDSHGSPYKVAVPSTASRQGTTLSPDRTPPYTYDYAPNVDNKREEIYKPLGPSYKAADPGSATTTGKTHSPDRTSQSALEYAQDVKPRLEELYDVYSPTHANGKPTEPSTPRRTYSPDETARTARDSESDLKPTSVKKYGVYSPSRAANKPSAASTPKRTFSPDKIARTERDYDSEVKPATGEKYGAYSLSHGAVNPSAASTPSRTHSPHSLTTRTPRYYSPEVVPGSVEKYDNNSTSREVVESSAVSVPDRTFSPHETPGAARGYTSEDKHKSGERYTPSDAKPSSKSKPEETPDEPSVVSTDGRLLPPKDAHRFKREYTGNKTYDLQTTDEPKALHETDRNTPSHIPTSLAREDEKRQIQTPDRERVPKYEVENSGEKVRKDYQQASEREVAVIPYERTGVSAADTSKKMDVEKTERKYADDTSYRGEERQDRTPDYAPATYGRQSSPILKTIAIDTSRTATSLPTDYSRGGESPDSQNARTGSEQKFKSAPEVPEIQIEDTDESGRSAPSERREIPMVGLPERAKFAIKGEMVLEPEQLGSPKYKISSQYESNIEDIGKIRETDGRTESRDKKNGAGARTRKTEGDRTYVDPAKADNYGGTHLASSGGRATSPLSPFPSLETPKIYMRPRQPCTDYGTACLPPIENDCPKKNSSRQNCVKNAGDLYMCQSQCDSTPQTACKCLCQRPSGSKVPYEKLGDQYTHSPVRQLAANSHLAVALQPEAATGNFIPSPQQSLCKSCTCFRTTGTQYSATILEQREDNCATQCVPLPKDCSETPIDEAERSPPPSARLCDSPNFQPASSTPQFAKGNYEFLCEEDNEEYEGKVNLNQDQWCGRVEITNMEKTQIFIAQKQGEQMQKSSFKGKDDKSIFLPWQQEQKFIPGQPLGSCNMSSWQDLPNGALLTKQRRFQNSIERRTPRFNATMPPHQEMPEEEERCEEEILHYKPQPRVKFMEQQAQQYRDCAPSPYTLNEESNFEDSRGRSSFICSEDYQQIPEFTGCPCMFKTYLNMVTLYYPECRIQITEDCNEFGVNDEFNE